MVTGNTDLEDCVQTIERMFQEVERARAPILVVRSIPDFLPETELQQNNRTLKEEPKPTRAEEQLSPFCPSLVTIHIA